MGVSHKYWYKCVEKDDGVISMRLSSVFSTCFNIVIIISKELQPIKFTLKLHCHLAFQRTCTGRSSVSLNISSVYFDSTLISRRFNIYFLGWRSSTNNSGLIHVDCFWFTNTEYKVIVILCRQCSQARDATRVTLTADRFWILMSD